MAIIMAPRSDRHLLEHGTRLALKFDDRGLVPVVTTCGDSGKLLMQAWANIDAVEATLTSGEAHYFSRSRSELWHKGATSGEIQKILEVRTDCDQDSLWYIVHQLGGGCCHTGHDSCFYRVAAKEGPNKDGSWRLEPAVDATRQK